MDERPRPTTPTQYLTAMAEAAEGYRDWYLAMRADLQKLAEVEPHLTRPLEIVVIHLDDIRQHWEAINLWFRRAALMAVRDRPIDPRAEEVLLSMTRGRDRPS